MLQRLRRYTEAVYVLDYNQNAQQDFLRWVAKGAVEIVALTSEEMLSVATTMKKYKDVPMDFADATLVFLG